MGLVRSIARRFSPSLNSPWTSGSEAGAGDGTSAPPQALGRAGEALAARYLWAHGMKVLYRNYRAPKGGEVDLVCRDGEELVFVEVKTRATLRFGRPADAVDLGKQRLISRGALAWLRMLGAPDVAFRFDIVEVVLAEGEVPAFSHLRAAFTLPEPYLYG